MHANQLLDSSTVYLIVIWGYQALNLFALHNMVPVLYLVAPAAVMIFWHFSRRGPLMAWLRYTRQESKKSSAGEDVRSSTSKVSIVVSLNPVRVNAVSLMCVAEMALMSAMLGLTAGEIKTGMYPRLDRMSRIKQHSVDRPCLPSNKLEKKQKI